MARITTKEYVAARQMKKNGDCIPGNKPGGAVSVCVTGEGVINKQRQIARATVLEVMWGIRNCTAGNKESPAGAGLWIIKYNRLRSRTNVHKSHRSRSTVRFREAFQSRAFRIAYMSSRFC